MRRLSTLVIIGVLTVPVLTGCTGEESAASTSTMLERALSRVAYAGETNLSVVFDYSAALAEFTGGEQVAEPPNYRELAGMGAGSIALMGEANEQLGIDLSAAEFAVTVGAPPTQYTLVAGGQDTTTIEERLGEWGWTADGELLTAPTDAAATDPDIGRHVLAMNRVAVSESDLVFGGGDADLSLVDGSTVLMDDERVARVADCLGEVAAAMINTVELWETSPMVGIGVRVPADGGERPRVVVCTSWGSEAEAVAYADRAHTELADGTSLSGRPYSELFDLPEAVTSDGSLASWESGTDLAMTVFIVWSTGALPGIILGCEQFNPAQLEAVGDSC
ncbi:hypothetical protein FB566_0741 [Stackebrandtia endophytica]|uniref:Uncharacterized protein n=1 Tax=Stackebrandtia endophytica TaxID=1496996 RepID=A0A543ARN8_9ACTN|nr:hypothetical protein [Stackebrandtia endophytica]TQL75244.1 hypothetical protein FB566_0741 [Stackebrandtia endophytica]